MLKNRALLWQGMIRLPGLLQHRRRLRPQIIDLTDVLARISVKHRVFTCRAVTVQRMGYVRYVIRAPRHTNAFRAHIYLYLSLPL